MYVVLLLLQSEVLLCICLFVHIQMLPNLYTALFVEFCYEN